MRIRTLLCCGLSALVAMLSACGGDNVSKNNDDGNGDTNNNAETNNVNADTNNDVGTNNDTNNDTNLCLGVMCSAPPPVCEGQELVTFTAGCDSTTGMCEGEELTRVDCVENGQMCENGECVDDGDACANVDCSAPEPACEGNDVVTFTSTCDPLNGMCVDEEVDRTDCTATDEVCEAGACVANDPTVTPGSLVVTEFMYDPTQVSDSAGEWIEIHNPTNRTLDIDGIKIKDDDSDEFVVDTGAALELGPGEYFVFGRSDDPDVNGGAPVDMAYGTAIQLSNTEDEIVITDANDVEIDRVVYDIAAGWLDVAGASLQLSSLVDAATGDNDDPANWCAGKTPYGDGDSGTPGAANEECTFDTHTIYEISDESDANHPSVGSGVSIEGVAITALGDSLMWIQETAGGEFSGVAVEIGGVDVSTFSVGDVVDVTGTYFEQFDRATIVLSTITDTNAQMLIAPETLSTDVLADAATAEPWEGVLVRVVEVGVTDDALGNGEVRIDSNVRVNDLLDDTFAMQATNCQVYDSLVGVLNYSFSNYKIEPRDANDVGSPTAATPVTNVEIAGLAFVPQHICITAGDTVTWINVDPVAHTVTERIPTETDPAANIPAAPTFDEMVDPNGDTATVTFADSGTYHYRCRPHSNMEGVIVAPD